MAEEQKTVVEQVVEDIPEESGADKGQSVAAAAAAAQGISPSLLQKQQSAAEKKARKAMQKKGFEQVAGITNISVLRRNAPMFSIYSPDVYKNANSDTWIMFGEARVDNNRMNAGAQSAARAAAAANGTSSAAPAAEAPAPAASESVDESGVDNNDVDLVMAQASCSRADAVKALKENSND
ncbi:hypothetical protein H4S02_012134, partial [Coemansia sp. RSA 2611]